MSEHRIGASVDPEARAGADELVRHEEELEIGTETRTAGTLGVRKHVDTERAEQLADRQVEHLDGVEREPAKEGDSGEVETLPDGSVSIPILEEELVVSKRIVVRERVIVRKRTETEQHRVQAELRKERVELEADERLSIEQASDRED